MSERSPQELDKLFQQGAEQQDFPYNADAWEQMDALLDKDKGRRRLLWWWLGGLFGLVVLASTLFLLQGEKDINPSLSVDKQFGVREVQSDSEPKSPAVAHQKMEAKVALEVEAIATQQLEGQKMSPASRKREHKKASNLPPREVQVLARSHDRTEPSSDGARPSKTVKAKPQTEKQIHINEFKIKTKISNISKLLYIDLKLKLSTVEKIALRDVEFKEARKNKTQNSLVLGLVAASEVSSVGTDDFSSLNWKLGAQLAYRFSTKYSISLGANFNRKSYEAGQGEYTPPKGFWTRGVAAQSAVGKCNILEIPLMLGYHFKGHEQDGFVVNAGIVSYLMLWEWYGYSYAQPSPDLVQEWTSKGIAQHWLGMSQFSVGYNKSLNNGGSIQLAPYLQIPLMGIGHGNVELWSTGVNVGFYFR